MHDCDVDQVFFIYIMFSSLHVLVKVIHTLCGYILFHNPFTLPSTEAMATINTHTYCQSAGREI